MLNLSGDGEISPTDIRKKLFEQCKAPQSNARKEFPIVLPKNPSRDKVREWKWNEENGLIRRVKVFIKTMHA